MPRSWALKLVSAGLLALVAASPSTGRRFESRCISTTTEPCEGKVAARLASETSSNTDAKAVFAHYMVGGINTAHAHKDIDDAVAMGLDAFALNIGDPKPAFVRDLFNEIFDYTRDNHPNFKLFFSLDLYAESNAYNGVVHLEYYDDLLRDFKGHGAYLQGPNGASFVSTFRSGGLQNTDWTNWRNKWGNDVYFVPNFDDTAGYYTADSAWWSYWGNVVDGIMSWETAWPKSGALPNGSVAVDETLAAGTVQHKKSYMIPLSTLQYKDAYGGNYYRAGELNFPERMANILSMPNSPNFVEYITWNDGPESHYIGNVWPEANSDGKAASYVNKQFPHTAWQSLLTSFITAFKAGVQASGMKPPSGQVAIGALWYKTILQSSVCPSGAAKPSGFDAGRDQLNYAIVVDPAQTGMTVRAVSNGAVSQSTKLHAGLNYGSFPAKAGQQRLEVVGANGNVVLTASGGRCISAECPDCIYNMNPQVVPLKSGAKTDGQCPAMKC